MSSDALVHLQVSTEYLIARAVEQLAGCLAQQAKVKQSRSKYKRQASPARRVKMYYEQEIKNIENVKRCRDGMPKSMQTR